MNKAQCRVMGASVGALFGWQNERYASANLRLNKALLWPRVAGPYLAYSITQKRRVQMQKRLKRINANCFAQSRVHKLHRIHCNFGTESPINTRPIERVSIRKRWDLGGCWPSVCHSRQFAALACTWNMLTNVISTSRVWSVTSGLGVSMRQTRPVT
jgi:hypothetical protein